jgi:hypothetical protein
MDTQPKTPPETPTPPTEPKIAEPPTAAPEVVVQETGALDSSLAVTPAPAPDVPAGARPVVTDPTKQAVAPSPSGKKPILVVAVAVVLFVALCAVAVYAYSKTS